jgi:hypothetical protein
MAQPLQSLKFHGGAARAIKSPTTMTGWSKKKNFPQAWANAQNCFVQIPELGETLKTILNKTPNLGKVYVSLNK